MNVYQKLQKCRAELKTVKIKESGNNTFAKYTYMELGDFLPHIVTLCETHGLCPVISFNDIATLTIFNSDNPEESIVFSSPMSTANLKGCHEIQNLGAVETYLRRYLYVNAFDIVEHDALDSTQGKEPAKQQQKIEVISAEQVTALRDILSMGEKYNEAVFCNQAKIARLEDLPAQRYDGAFKHAQGVIAAELQVAA